MQEGGQIYVESLLNDSDYKKYSKMYKTYKSNNKIDIFDCEFKWRYRMGEPLTSEEIILINGRIDIILKKFGIYER